MDFPLENDPDYLFDEGDPMQEAADEAYLEAKTDSYEEGYEDGEGSIDPLVAGAFFAMGAGAAEELDERKLREKVLNKPKAEPEVEKVPLGERHDQKIKKRHKIGPFYRWADAVCKGQKPVDSPIALNKEEKSSLRKRELEDIKAIDKLMGY